MCERLIPEAADDEDFFFLLFSDPDAAADPHRRRMSIDEGIDVNEKFCSTYIWNQRHLIVRSSSGRIVFVWIQLYLIDLDESGHARKKKNVRSTCELLLPTSLPSAKKKPTNRIF